LRGDCLTQSTPTKENYPRFPERGFFYCAETGEGTGERLGCDARKRGTALHWDPGSDSGASLPFGSCGSSWWGVRAQPFQGGAPYSTGITACLALPMMQLGS